MGDGFAIIPADGIFVSPVKGEVIQVFPTKHAIGIKTENGLEILIHIGLNTVELNGGGFEMLTKVGKKVKPGDDLIKVNLELLKEKGLDIITPVIITNLDEKVQRLETIASSEVNKGELVLNCILN